MIIENKIITTENTHTSRVFFGNPQIELTEGVITYKLVEVFLNGKRKTEIGESELELIKQHIWEMNIKNNHLDSNQLVCINVPNKISINEFLTTFSIYLSYIQQIRVMKSPAPNLYFILLKMKNKEYANIFYNTFNYTKVNPIEKEYYIFAEVKEVTFEEIYTNGICY